MSKAGWTLTIIVVGILVITGVLVIASTTSIPQGHVGLVWSVRDGVQDEVLGEGWRVVNPTHRVTAIPVSTETVNVTRFDVITRDGKTLGIYMSYDYFAQADRVTDIFTMFRGQDISVIESGWLEDRVQRASLNVFGRYSVMDVFQNLARIQQDVFEEFRDLVLDYGFSVTAVTIQAPALDHATQEMIQSVIDAQLELERMAVELEQEVIESDVRIERARGHAEALEIEARAEAAANDLLLQSLSQELIMMQWIESWNGELPVVSGDGNFFIDINALFEEGNVDE